MSDYWEPVLTEADAILDELKTTDDPLDRGFICLRSVAHVAWNIRTWDEL